jgi:hypothetical protein
LRKLKQLRREILSAAEADMEVVWTKGNLRRQTGENAVSRIRRGRDVDPACGGVLSKRLKRVDDPSPASDLPLEAIASRCCFEPLDKSSATHADCIADLYTRKSRHQLSGASLADAEDPLNGEAVQKLLFKVAEFA